MNKSTNNYYLDSIKKKIEKLELRKKQYEVELIQQSKTLEQNDSAIQRLKFTNSILHDQYNSLIRLIENQGIVFEVSFNEYKPHQWENLLLVKTSNGYEIQTKAGSILTMLDENFSKIIQDISRKDSYSLIVTRVTEKATLLQLRFN